MLRPFFESKRVRLFCGNSLDVLNELKENGEHFDLMLTDPPYGLDQKNNKTSGLNAKRAKASYKDDLFDDTFEYLQNTVRPIFDLSMSMCNLGIITAGVGCYKYLPPPKRKVACSCQPRLRSTLGRWLTTSRYGTTGSRKATTASTAGFRLRSRSADSRRTTHARSLWFFGRSSCYAELTARKTRRYSTRSAVAERLEEPRRT